MEKKEHLVFVPANTLDALKEACEFLSLELTGYSLTSDGLYAMAYVRCWDTDLFHLGAIYGINRD